MVRTYRPGRNEMLSPWEKAMRNADSEEGRPANTGKRMYAEWRVTNSSMETGTPRSLKLPPISEDPQQMIQFLGEEVGKALARSKDKLKKMKKEFVLYDQDETSLMNKNSAFAILERYKVPDNENYQKKVLAFFVDPQLQNKINYRKMTEFFENSKKHYKEKMQFTRMKEEENSGQAEYSNNYHGRYDSNASNNQVKLKPRKAHEQAFRERIDAGMMLEIERAMNGYRKGDPVQLIDELEESLRRTCGNEDNLTDNGHVRSLVNKHDVPINAALILKCIDRLDPNNTGSIEWPKFIEFFRRAIGASPRRPRTDSTFSTASSIQSQNYLHPHMQTPQIQQEVVPDKPAWETRQPLSSIGNHSNRSDDNANKWETTSMRTLTPLNSSSVNHNPSWNQGYEMNDHSISNPNGYNDHPQNYQYEAQSQPNDNPYNNNGYDNGYYGDNNYDQSIQQEHETNDEFPEMADDLEAAFAKSVSQLRSSKVEEPVPEQEEEQQQPSFAQHGERGNIYKMVAGALRDKAKQNNGRMHTNEVRKIMSYYNLLFDADFPMDKINGLLHRHSSNDEVHCEKVIKMFGKEII